MPEATRSGSHPSGNNRFNLLDRAITRHHAKGAPLRLQVVHEDGTTMRELGRWDRR